MEILGVVLAFVFIVGAALAWAMLTEVDESDCGCGCPERDEEIYTTSDSTRYKDSSVYLD